MPASAQPRRRRRRVEATGTVRVAWRAKGPVWVMKYRLPDGTESMKVIGPAWVKRDPDDARAWLARRGRPPEGVLSETAATAALRTFLDEQTERTPPERVTFARCAEAFLERCEEKNRSPTTLRTYRQVVAEITERWEGWRIVDVDADELEDYRDELAERGLAASTLNQRRAVLSGVFKVARRRYRVGVDPMDGFERAEIKAAGDLEVYSVEEVWALVRAAASLTGRGHLPDRRALRPAPLGDPRPALARRALRAARAAAAPRLHRGRAATACPRASACTPSRWRRRSRRAAATRARRARPRRARLPRREGRRDGRLGAVIAATSRPSSAPASGACASTICATPSAPRRSPPARTSWTSRTGSATATSRRRCATSTTSRATRPPSASDATSAARQPNSMRCWAIPRACVWVSPRRRKRRSRRLRTTGIEPDKTRVRGNSGVNRRCRSGLPSTKARFCGPF